MSTKGPRRPTLDRMSSDPVGKITVALDTASSLLDDVQGFATDAQELAAKAAEEQQKAVKIRAALEAQAKLIRELKAQLAKEQVARQKAEKQVSSLEYQNEALRRENAAVEGEVQDFQSRVGELHNRFGEAVQRRDAALSEADQRNEMMSAEIKKLREQRHPIHKMIEAGKERAQGKGENWEVPLEEGIESEGPEIPITPKNKKKGKHRR